jgi:CyaY protein
MTTLDEKVYRRIVDDVFAAIDAAYEGVDPDLAESSYGQGTLTVLFRGATKLIVSPQPPVRQIWVAFRDRAWHFDRDEATGRWLDDRGQGIELFGLVERITREETGESVSIRR